MATTNIQVESSGCGVWSNGVPFPLLPTPNIQSISSSSGSVGTAITIAGSNFGSTQSSSVVAFNGAPATPTSWSNATIVAAVPVAASTGLITVNVNGVASTG